MDKNIFIVWSGELSHEVALALHSWLPTVIPNARPFCSSVDIAKGGTWFADLRTQLNQVDFGIVCVTRENLNVPWIFFESGSLSNKLGKLPISPLLIGLSAVDLSGGPLAHFQSTAVTEKDIERLVNSINSAIASNRKSTKRLNRAFATAWPRLEAKLESLFNQFRDVVEQGPGAGLSLTDVKAKFLPTVEMAFDYMALRILKAKLRIDHAALAPEIKRMGSSATNWEDAISEILNANHITYRYVALLTDIARRKRVKQYLLDDRIEHYFVKFYQTTRRSIPALSFLIVDDLEVIMHYPYEPGQPETFVAINDRSIASLFVAYYNKIWLEANELNRDNMKLVLSKFSSRKRSERSRR